MLIIVAVGLQKILSLLESEDEAVQVHAVKVVANLAAEGTRIEMSALLASLKTILKARKCVLPCLFY